MHRQCNHLLESFGFGRHDGAAVVVDHGHLIDALQPTRALDRGLFAVHTSRDNLFDVQRLDSIGVFGLLRDSEAGFDDLGSRVHCLEKTADARKYIVINHINLRERSIAC